MSKTTLKFTVIIEADPSTVHDIKTMLAKKKSEQSALRNLLAGVIKEKINAAGVTDDLEVKLGRVGGLSDGGGGLSSQEWLGKDRLSDDPINPGYIHDQGFHD